MSRWLLGLGLLLAAALVHVAIERPARRERDLAREEYARARAERERLRAELARLEHRSPAGAAQAPAGDAAAVRALRLSLLAATHGLPLADVKIAAEPERGGALAAHGRLEASGTQADLLRAAARLAEPASGLRLERVELTGGPAGHRLEVETVNLRSGS